MAQKYSVRFVLSLLASFLLFFSFVSFADKVFADGTPTYVKQITHSFSTPYGVAVDSSGNLYVVDSGNNQVQKFDSSGNFINEFGASGSGNGQFNAPEGIAVDSSGNIYISDTGNDRIEEFNSAEAYVTQWTTASGAGVPGLMYINQQGNLVIDGGYTIEEYTTSGSQVSLPDIPGLSGYQTTGIAGDSSNNIYTGGSYYYSNGNSIGIYTSTGSSTSPITLASNMFIHGIALGPDNDIYVGIYNTLAGPRYEMDKYTVSGTQIGSAFANSGSAQLNSVNGIAVSPDNTYIYVADYSSNSIYVFQNPTSATPPTLSVQSASSIATSSATLNGTIVATGGASSTSEGFNYGLNTSYGSVASTTGTFGTGSFSQSISGLSPNTTYHYEAFASNTAGTGTSSDQTFTTGSVTIHPTVTTQAVSSIGPISATGNGTITATGGSTVTAQGFVWGLTTSYGATTTLSGSFGTSTFAGPVTGLSCNTTYHVNAFAVNASGISYGSDQTFTTGGCVTVATFGLPNSAVYAPGWLATSTGIMTQHAGEYLKFAVQNTANVTLTLNTASLNAANIDVRSFVDGTQSVDTIINTGSTTVTIASGLSSARHEILFETRYLDNDGQRWTDQSTMLQVQNIYLDSGASLLAPGNSDAIRPTYAIWDTDSLGEYDSTTNDTDDANTTFPTLVSNYFNWEHEHRAFSGTGYYYTYTVNPPLYIPGGAANQPLNAYDSNDSELVNGKLQADTLVWALGTNDINNVSDSVLETRIENDLTYTRTIFTGSIYVVPPLTYSNNDAAITTAVNAYTTSSGDTRVHLIDIGSTNRTTLEQETIDGTHLSVAGQANASSMLESLFASSFDAPTTPLNVTAVAGMGQATISFTRPSSDGGSAITQYSVLSTPGNISATTTATSTILSGLTPGQSYTFTVKATNAVGDSVYSSSSNSVVISGSNPPTLSVQAASSIATSTATLNGTITSNNNASSTVEGFNYGLTTSYGSVASSTGTFGTGAYSLNISGLSPSTTYHFQAFAINTGGSGTSPDQTFTTSALGAPVISSIASSTTQTTATITWTTDQAASSTVKFGGTSSYGSASTTVPLVTSHSIILSGLTAATTYHFQVGGANAGGTVSTSSDMVFVTSSAISVSAPTLTIQPATSVDTSTATLNGTIVSTGGANATQSGFVFGTTDATPTLILGTATSGLGTYLVAGTSSMTLYKSAADSPGVSNCTGTCAIIWPPYIVSTSTSLDAQTGLTGTLGTITRGDGSLQVTYNSLPLYFFESDSVPGNTTGQNVGGFTVVNATATPGFQSTAGSFAATLSNLAPNTLYHFAPYAVNTAGTSYGSYQTFTTTATSNGGGGNAIVSSGGSGGFVLLGGGGSGSAATPAATSTPGCLPGNLFNTETGAQCPVMPPIAGCLPGYRYNTATGALCPVTPTISNSAPSSSASSPATNAFTKDLTLGITSPEVKLLQKYLNTHGFTVAQKGTGSLGNESDYFGQLTKAALIRFQIAKDIIPSVGYFGPITRAYIASH